jgi:hypothetical protein
MCCQCSGKWQKHSKVAKVQQNGEKKSEAVESQVKWWEK